MVIPASIKERIQSFKVPDQLEISFHFKDIKYDLSIQAAPWDETKIIGISQLVLYVYYSVMICQFTVKF